MDVYVYEAALLCSCCGEATRERLTVEGKAPADLRDESSYDSDDFPKGPYPDGGGESDSPQHCDHCNVFLQNPLTEDGADYLRQVVALRPYNNDTVIKQWVSFYGAEILGLQEEI